MDRRDFVIRASAGAALGGLGAPRGDAAAASGSPALLSFGVVTDVHYADIPPRGLRHYSQSIEKLKQAVATFRSRKVDFIIELGDFIDADPEKKRDLEYLQAVLGVWKTFPGPRHHVLGNHCVWAVPKPAFLAACGRERSWYSFDSGPVHAVVLDACFSRDESPYVPGAFDWKDSWVPAAELHWLADDLARAKDRTVLVFVHQNLHDETRPCGVKNAPEVRRILEQAGNVLAVFQGHEHPGAYARIGGIHYITLRALIEGPELANNAYAIVSLPGDRRLRVEGFGQQPHLTLE